MNIETNPVVTVLQEVITLLQNAMSIETDYARRDRIKTYVKTLNVIALWFAS